MPYLLNIDNPRPNLGFFVKLLFGVIAIVAFYLFTSE